MMVSMIMAEELKGLQKALDAYSRYILSLPTRDWFGTKEGSKDSGSEKDSEHYPSTRSHPWLEADALKSLVSEVTELQVKITSELRYAKREFAWGKLGPKDLDNVCALLKKILLPVLGMESLIHVTDRLEKRGGWAAVVPNADHALSDRELNALEAKEIEQWGWIFEQYSFPIHQLQRTMNEGIEHALYTLELAKRPKSHIKTDLEAHNSEITPGGKEFAKHLKDRIDQFLVHREGPLKEWCSSKGMDENLHRVTNPLEYPFHQRHQSQLYLILDVIIHSPGTE
jgi:hypothetical protein